MTTHDDRAPAYAVGRDPDDLMRLLITYRGSNGLPLQETGSAFRDRAQEETERIAKDGFWCDGHTRFIPAHQILRIQVNERPEP